MADIPIVDLEARADEPAAYGEAVADYTVIDVDAHFLCPFRDVVDYMDDPWGTRMAKLVEDTWREERASEARTEDGRLGSSRRQAYGGAGGFFPGTTGDRQQYGKVIREHSAYPDAPQEIEKIPDGMEFLGVDKTVQISHLMLASGGIKADDQRVPSFFRAYTEYVAEEVLDPEQGIYGFVPIPKSDVGLGLELLEYAEDHEGFLAGCMITGGGGPPLGNRKYDPIYERSSEMGLPICFHTSGSGLDNYAGAGSFTQTHILGFLQSNQQALVSLVLEGVPEKFPDLDMVIVESGITYIPSIAARMDEEWLLRTEESPLLEKRPSEYLFEDFYYSTQPLETNADPQYLERCFELVGDRLMYASDYPHWDFDHPSTIANLPFLDEETKQRILAGNAQEVFGL